jgi:hypothetical protein
MDTLKQGWFDQPHPGSGGHGGRQNPLWWRLHRSDILGKVFITGWLLRYAPRFHEKIRKKIRIFFLPPLQKNNFQNKIPKKNFKFFSNFLIFWKIWQINGHSKTAMIRPTSPGIWRPWRPPKSPMMEIASVTHWCPVPLRWPQRLTMILRKTMKSWRVGEKSSYWPSPHMSKSAAALTPPAPHWCLGDDVSPMTYPQQDWCVVHLQDKCPVHLFVISSTAEVSSRLQNRELRY